MEAGEMESAQVVMRLASAYSLQATRAALPPDALPDPPVSAQRSTPPREAGEAQDGEEAAARARMLAALGEARTDLGRFGGIYGNAPDGDGGRRTFFVTVTCEGHLMVGPMWADVAPWRMRSLGDTEFRWAGNDFADPVRATFATGQDGTATGLTVDLEGFTEPMIRLSDLDPGWQSRCPGGG
jgi:hypothetical protein